jgi:hypothetical protein
LVKSCLLGCLRSSCGRPSIRNSRVAACRRDKGRCRRCGGVSSGVSPAALPRCRIGCTGTL